MSGERVLGKANDLEKGPLGQAALIIIRLSVPAAGHQPDWASGLLILEGMG